MTSCVIYVGTSTAFAYTVINGGVPALRSQLQATLTPCVTCFGRDSSTITINSTCTTSTLPANTLQMKCTNAGVNSVVQCAPGWIDNDGVFANGCETSTSFSMSSVVVPLSGLENTEFNITTTFTNTGFGAQNLNTFTMNTFDGVQTVSGPGKFATTCGSGTITQTTIAIYTFSSFSIPASSSCVYWTVVKGSTASTNKVKTVASASATVTGCSGQCTGPVSPPSITFTVLRQCCDQATCAGISGTTCIGQTNGTCSTSNAICNPCISCAPLTCSGTCSISGAICSGTCGVTNCALGQGVCQCKCGGFGLTGSGGCSTGVGVGSGCTNSCNQLSTNGVCT